MQIIVDTREQFPFTFRKLPVTRQRGTLHTGDYSLSGFENKITVERKSLGDLASCMTVGRERFEKELQRMLEFESAVVVVEEPLANIRNGKYRSNLKPESFEQSILAFMIRYRVPFLFGKNRSHAEWLCFNVLRHFHNWHVPAKDKIPFTPYQWG